MSQKNKDKRGWFENPNQTGKAPEHVAASQRSKTKEVLRQPMTKKLETDKEIPVFFKAKECKTKALEKYVELHNLKISEEAGTGLTKIIAPDEGQLAELEDFLNDKEILEEESETEEED